MEIGPEQLWNAGSLIQQVIFAGVLLIIYLIIRFLANADPQSHPGLQNWLQNLHGLFYLQKGTMILLAAPVLGAVFSVLLFGMDSLAGLLQKKDMKLWIRRSDNMLPENTVQRRWALLITLSGSTVEELMFRAFIFTALLPVWNSWIWAALLISAVFSLLHTGIQGFWPSVWIFIISVLLCYLLTAGFSIYTLILIHIGINLTNLFVFPRILGHFQNRNQD